MKKISMQFCTETVSFCYGTMKNILWFREKRHEFTGKSNCLENQIVEAHHHMKHAAWCLNDILAYEWIFTDSLSSYKVGEILSFY